VEVVAMDDLSGASKASVAAGVELRELDLATPEAVRIIIDARPDSVVHYAAQTSVPASFADPVRDAWSTILGRLRVIEACRRSGVAEFVCVTTGGALCGRPMTALWDERAAVTPTSPYGISKSIVESYLNVIASASHVTVLRLANVYGPRQVLVGEARVVATFIDRMRGGLPVVIHGDGEQTRDLLYVEDAVDAIEVDLQRV
jgi:UDP-glucose 4-epimerase